MRERNEGERDRVKMRLIRLIRMNEKIEEHAEQNDDKSTKYDRQRC